MSTPENQENKSITKNNILWNEYLKALNHEVVPALGCTEPISLALASAVAAKYLFGHGTSVHEKFSKISKIEGFVSPNLMKNGMGVSVPGTGMVGLPIAAAVGALGGNPDGNLEVLKGLTNDVVELAKKMLDKDKVSVVIEPSTPILYSKSRISTETETVSVTISDGHTHIVNIEKNGETIFEAVNDITLKKGSNYDLSQASVLSIVEFAEHIPLSQIAFILQAQELNDALSKEGLAKEYGLHIGRTLQGHIKNGLLSDDLQNQIVIRSTAASDARMGGAVLPAMSNSGSGNQGISATLPVVVVADYLQVDNEKRARALIISHLIAIYIHSKLPKLSALCAVSTAAMGAGAGMAWLLAENKYAAIDRTLSSMVGDIAGIICDGAANSCAMKVSTSATSALKSVLMALNDTGVTANEGIVSHNADKSIDNLCQLAQGSMLQTDVQIIEIMVNKDSC
ncbi:L-cysteine desulfidase family protein [Thorsellia kenyensis]|uniref:UPF0597 protein ACFFIT_01090 n=1 Tax=Thorsellia kenyensis TaxID=1549888 RepID=A0ABV6C6V7_9GAMM